eukprot:489322_1
MYQNQNDTMKHSKSTIEIGIKYVKSASKSPIRTPQSCSPSTSPDSFTKGEHTNRFTFVNDNEQYKPSKPRNISLRKVFQKIKNDINYSLSAIDWVGIKNKSMLVGIQGFTYKIQFDIHITAMKEIPKIYILSVPIPNHININQRTGEVSARINDLQRVWKKKAKYYNKVFRLLLDLCGVAESGSLHSDDIVNPDAFWKSHNIVRKKKEGYRMFKYDNYKIFIDFVGERKRWYEEQSRLESEYDALHQGLLYN